MTTKTLKQWFDLIGQKDSIFDVPDPQAFKRATAAILCNILHLENTHKKEELAKFCDISFEGNVSKSSDEIKKNIEVNTKIIKEQFGGDEYKMLEFMKMLNNFIMVDDCKDEDYCVFEEVQSLLFAKS